MQVGALFEGSKGISLASLANAGRPDAARSSVNRTQFFMRTLGATPGAHTSPGNLRKMIDEKEQQKALKSSDQSPKFTARAQQTFRWASSPEAMLQPGFYET
jgi:hypothetical protein